MIIIITAAEITITIIIITIMEYALSDLSCVNISIVKVLKIVFKSFKGFAAKTNLKSSLADPIP